jgi:lysyl-tRNA synthetase class 2
MSARPEQLRRRSDLLQALRRFFVDRDFVEVETPLLSAEVIPELHIEPICADSEPSNSRESESTRHGGTRRSMWLQASPELHMKRLLASGMSAIFQVTRSFRAGERGRLHNPEFTLVEWYRTGDDMPAGMKLIDELLQTLLAAPPAARTSYAAAFEKLVGVDPHRATAAELAALGIEPAAGMRIDDRDEWLNLLLALKVEPHLGRDGPEILYDFPESQAALARVVERENGKRVAERFELYLRGVELANGYCELTDAAELRRRFEAVNDAREADGRRRLPLPESLLTAMASGLPACTGCALGFDRLAMLAVEAESIDEVMTFPGNMV